MKVNMYVITNISYSNRPETRFIMLDTVSGLRALTIIFQFLLDFFPCFSSLMLVKYLDIPVSDVFFF